MLPAMALLLAPRAVPAQNVATGPPGAAHQCPVGPAPPGYIAHPRWTNLPDPSGGPSRLRPPGCAIVDCLVSTKRRQEGCELLVALPPEEDYGAKALGLARWFIMDKVDADGAPVVGRRVRVPIRWVIAPEEPEAPTP
jgi:hypothetical protein